MPLGLHGELNINILVFSVIAFSICSAVTLKLFSTDEGISTGTPSASFMISEYETQYGQGRSTSSLGFNKLKQIFARDCLAPVETTI